MDKRKILLGVCLFLLTLSFFTSAFASQVIGLSQPRDWRGSGSRVQYYDPDQQLMDSDFSSVPFATTSVNYSSGDVTASATSAYKALSGSIYGEDVSIEWQTGGYYRDQIRITTYNGQPAELGMTFNVNASGSTFGESCAKAWLNVGWGMYTSETSYPLSNQFLININAPNDSASTNGAITLRSSDGDYVFESGSYVPFSISAWGSVVHGELNWPDTIEFVGFSVFQDGIQLSPEQFTIVEGVQAVPISPSVLLLGTGLLGMMGYQRFRKNR